MGTNGLYEEVMLAGFGGQGIILGGKLLAEAAMRAGKEVTYIPSYGAEMRGGTANSMIIIADGPIASPMVSRPTTLITMNKASLNKFGPRIKNGGLLVMNSSLIENKPELDDSIEILSVPADAIALELGNKRVANMVAIGAYVQNRGLFGVNIAEESLEGVLAKRYHKTVPINIEALRRGAEFASK
ncbi:MAG: 2-oxoacid:acceptor oxidoreductase family protein [Planctomycetes bacterium]|nr:2-oxoacid:acceptor oxidoreductase family protein [Planctomycetota bacterium]